MRKHFVIQTDAGERVHLIGKKDYDNYVATMMEAGVYLIVREYPDGMCECEGAPRTNKVRNIKPKLEGGSLW